MTTKATYLPAETVEALFPGWLLTALKRLMQKTGDSVFLTGGTVRDLLLAKMPEDVDLTVASDAKFWARSLAERVGGAYVPLGRNEDAARVVYAGTIVDFSSFRQGATSISEELGKRDITINSLGLKLDPLLDRKSGDTLSLLPVIDPCGGAGDLASGVVKMTFADAFVDDPLRLLRVFRFAALLGFEVESGTEKSVIQQCSLIGKVAPERVQHELDLIMASDRAASIFLAMAQSGLLWEVLPELKQGVGVRQPSSHHLDVFLHNVETLLQMEKILAAPDRGFEGEEETIGLYVENAENRVRLKWAALFHDIGKPAVYAVDGERDNRITFYNHDRVGVDILQEIATALRWSRRASEQVSRLIAHHMRPFHLVNSARRETVSTKACIRLVKSVGAELPGLFLLAMADAAAGQGELRPPDMEDELAQLYRRVEEVRREHIAPVLEGPPLITGKDLIRELDLSPGPLFKEILTAISEARMQDLVTTRDQALAMARDIAAVQGDGIRGVE